MSILHFDQLQPLGAALGQQDARSAGAKVRRTHHALRRSGARFAGRVPDPSPVGVPLLAPPHAQSRPAASPPAPHPAAPGCRLGSRTTRAGRRTHSSSSPRPRTTTQAGSHSLGYRPELLEARVLDPSLSQAGDVGAGHNTACGVMEVLSAPPAPVGATVDLKEVFELLRDLDQGCLFPPLNAVFASRYYTIRCSIYETLRNLPG